ncbi:MAG: helix-turn-helix transcriptional regulator [Paracoccaceae bacterium]|nr:helix-turn-helix transcriptional regulator [Paracoccaceae bacterium]
MTTQFGTALRHLRRELGLSQAALALQVGTTQRHVSFMETGRSRPGQQMLGRLATELNLNAGQRAALFDASDYRNPYKRRAFDSDEVTEALDMIEHRILRHWPFPAFALDSEWTFLRMNAPAKKMFAPFRDPESGKVNFFSLILSDAFRSLIVNFDEVLPTFYFRLQAAAAHSPAIRTALEEARSRGLFKGISTKITGQEEIPIYVPVVLDMGEVQLKITSLLGQLVSVHDSLVEGFEIELMLPVDEASETCLLAALG